MAGLRAIGAVAVVTLVLPTTSDAAVVQLRLGTVEAGPLGDNVATQLGGASFKTTISTAFTPSAPINQAVSLSRAAKRAWTLG